MESTTVEHVVGTTWSTNGTHTEEEHVAQGRHLMLTLKGCPEALLDDEHFLREATERAVRETGASMLNVTSHHFEPQGVTILALLAESHASMHTYPEVGVAFWDCFTCGWECDPVKSVAALVDALVPASTEWSCITRGDGTDTKHAHNVGDG